MVLKKLRRLFGRKHDYDQDFPDRVRMLQRLLTKGSDDLVLKHGPLITAQIDPMVFQPYLRGSARDRLPLAWDQFPPTEDVDEDGGEGTATD